MTNFIMRNFTVKLLATHMTFFAFLTCLSIFLLFIILFSISKWIKPLKTSVSSHLKSSFDLFYDENLLIFWKLIFFRIVRSAYEIIAIITFGFLLLSMRLKQLLLFILDFHDVLFNLYIFELFLFRIFGFYLINILFTLADSFYWTLSSLLTNNIFHLKTFLQRT
jgi:hypothetical protein